MVVSHRAMRVVRATADERKPWNSTPISKACPKVGDPRGWRVYLVNVSPRRYWFRFKSQATSEVDAKRKATAVQKNRDETDPSRLFRGRGHCSAGAIAELSRDDSAGGRLNRNLR